MNKKILIRLSLIFAVVAATIGVTVAYFRDTEVSTGNKFVAGKFNLQVGSQCTYNGQPQTDCTWLTKDLQNDLLFNFTDVKPGDYGENTLNLKIDDNPAWICAQLTNIKNFDNGCETPEMPFDQTCGNPGEGQGELQNNLRFTVWKDTDCDNQLDQAGPAQCVTSNPQFDPGCGTLHEEQACNSARAPGDPTQLCHWVNSQPSEQVLVNSQPAQNLIWPISDSTNGTPLLKNQNYCLGVSWNVPLATTNIIQTDSVTGDIKFVAVQSRNMATFKCSDLFTEVCDQIDNDGDGQIDEGNVCAPTPSAETCGDGIDNDGNGLIDENCGNLYFSQYIEGTGSNKALEIYNPTADPINLTGYSVSLYVNGSSTPSTPINLSGILDPGDVYIVCHPAANPAITGICNLQSAQLAFNGDDAIALKNGSTFLDVIGQIGNDPGTNWGIGLTSTLDHTLVRKCSVTQGDPIGSDFFDPITQWDGYTVDTFSYLGSHLCP